MIFSPKICFNYLESNFKKIKIYHWYKQYFHFHQFFLAFYTFMERILVAVYSCSLKQLCSCINNFNNFHPSLFQLNRWNISSVCAGVSVFLESTSEVLYASRFIKASTVFFKGVTLFEKSKIVSWKLNYICFSILIKKEEKVGEKECYHLTNKIFFFSTDAYKFLLIRGLCLNQ